MGGRGELTEEAQAELAGLEEARAEGSIATIRLKETKGQPVAITRQRSLMDLRLKQEAN